MCLLFSQDSKDDHFFQSHVFVELLNVFTCSWKQSPFVFINGGGGGGDNIHCNNTFAGKGRHQQEKSVLFRALPE